jgi:hypothetical protein
MTPGDSFDSKPDAALGRLLRAYLDPGGHDAFVARVVAASRPVPIWDVLARWTRVGVAAAAVIASVAALGSRALTRADADGSSIADAIAPAGMLAAQASPVPGGTLVSLPEE